MNPVATTPGSLRRKRTFQHREVAADGGSATDIGRRDSFPAYFSITKTLLEEEMRRLAVIESGELLITAQLASEERTFGLSDSINSEYSLCHASAAWTEFSRVAVPAGLIADRAKCGILSEIGRIWSASAAKLTLWDYRSDSHSTHTLQCGGKVLSVRVTPRVSDQYTPSVRCMLLVCTTAGVVLYGVVFEPQFALIPTEVALAGNVGPDPVFASFATGKVVVGGPGDRISQLKPSNNCWLSTAKRYKWETSEYPSVLKLVPRALGLMREMRVERLAGDEERRLLYVLLRDNKRDDGRVDIYDVRENVRKRLSVTTEAILKDTRKGGFETGKEPLVIVDIFVIAKTASARYHFVAMTQNGLRIYVALNLDENKVAGFYAKPPPKGTFHHESLKFSMLEDGTMLFSTPNRLVSIQKGNEKSTKPTQSIANSTTEVASVLDLPTITAISHPPVSSTMPQSVSELCGLTPIGDFPLPSVIPVTSLPSYSNFLYVPGTQFCVLTSSHLIHYVKIREIDRVAAAVSSDSSRAIDELREEYGTDQVASWLLALATGPNPQAEYIGHSAFVSTGVSPQVRSKAKNEFLRVSSPENDCIPLHLSRILRPIWLRKLTHGENSGQIFSLSPGHFALPRSLLVPFLSFIEKQYTTRLLPFHSDARSKERSGYVDDPLYQIYLIGSRCLHAISLIEILSAGRNFRKITQNLSSECQQALSDLTFRDLVGTVRGQQVAKALIDAYIRCVQPSANLGLLTTTISSFFTETDAEIYTAEDMLLRADKEVRANVRCEMVQTGLGMLVRNAAAVNVKRCVKTLIALNETRGAAILALEKTKTLSEIGTNADSEEMNQCFAAVLSVLSEIHTEIVDYSQDLTALRMEIIKESLKIPIKSLHFAVFNWLVQWNLSNILPAVDSQYILPFLESRFPSSEFPALPYIADYCLRTKEYERAFEEYDRLAGVESQKDDNLTLKRRLELLDLALLCAGNALNVGKTLKIGIKKAKETVVFRQKLCLIQVKIQELTINRANSQEIAHSLDKKLYTALELFELYAKPLGLTHIQIELLDFIVAKPPSSGQIAIIESIYPPLLRELATNSDWPNTAMKKLKELWSKFPFAFPLHTICKECEEINAILGVESPWLPRLLCELDGSLDSPRLFSAYKRIWAECSNSDFQLKFHLWCKLAFLIDLRPSSQNRAKTGVVDSKRSTIPPTDISEVLECAMQLAARLPETQRLLLWESIDSIKTGLERRVSLGCP